VNRPQRDQVDGEDGDEENEDIENPSYSRQFSGETASFLSSNLFANKSHKNSTMSFLSWYVR
jgi:hypothetical protein